MHKGKRSLNERLSVVAEVDVPDVADENIDQWQSISHLGRLIGTVTTVNDELITENTNLKGEIETLKSENNILKQQIENNSKLIDTYLMNW